ncbi:MAG: hypothetical protein IKO46_07090 [Salinivirgaceae bacterium]|nr:hypothetical protein [Salinivirgaceae bacterium]MBR4620732.1 hypothetical protein [Salinivirgaceae bacterium]
MKAKSLFIIIAIFILAGCKPESNNCPRMIEVPFDEVSIPDSIKAQSLFTIDAKLHDYGCYQTSDILGIINCDTIYLHARANYDECECPSKPECIELEYVTYLDTVSHGSTMYYVYLKVDENKDSIRVCVDTVYLY